MNDPTNPPAPAPTHRKFLRIRDVTSRTRLCKSTIYAKIRLKQFPAQVPLGSISVWVESEVSEWMDEQVAARDKAA